MIQLFNTPKDVIDLKHHDNLLHGSAVKKFEEEFARYVGARHACSFNSASSAIFLALTMVKESWPHLLAGRKLAIPSTIPPVVPNAIINAGVDFQFIDNVDWIGHLYTLANLSTFRIIDSAQAVYEQIFQLNADPQDLMIFSFYPTKPIGGLDGGMIVSDDSDKIESLRKMSLNGAGTAVNSWERSVDIIGWKMYMNSIQAQIANQQLDFLFERQASMNHIRDRYNNAFDMKNVPRPRTEGQKGYHLYRIYVQDNQNCVRRAKGRQIICGIHYRSLHHHPLYGKYGCDPDAAFTSSNYEHLHTISIPFHEELGDEDIAKVIDFITGYQDLQGQPTDE